VVGDPSPGRSGDGSATLAFSLIPPCVALFLDMGEPGPECCDLNVQLAGIYSHLHQLLLRLGQLKAQLGVFGRQFE
jgi:hypothetical protein